MEKCAILPVETEGLLGTVRRFLTSMLQQRLVDALLVPMELSPGGTVVSSIVSHTDKLVQANPLAPVLPVNTARLVSRITRVSPSPGKLGIVLRSCELRALIELVKLKQASLDNLLLIGVDCPGTYSLSTARKLVSEGRSPTEAVMKRFLERAEDPLLRKACAVCECPAPQGADITIGLFGADVSKNILLISSTAKGEEIVSSLSLNEGKAEGRQSALSALVGEKVKQRENLFKETSESIQGLDKLRAVFSSCTNCHNCREACPICYCKECFFDSDVFESKAEKYLVWSKRKGALRMPTDTLLFHLALLNHMVISCVGCGLCTEACPNDIPISNIFRLVGYQVQKEFDYHPGRSIDEELPLTAFREDELTDIGI